MHDKAQFSKTHAKWSTFVRSLRPSCACFCARADVHRRPKRYREASWTLLGSFQENFKIRAFSNTRCHTKFVRAKEIRSENKISPTTP